MEVMIYQEGQAAKPYPCVSCFMFSGTSHQYVWHGRLQDFHLNTLSYPDFVKKC